jgi:DNA-binding NtrC family response regulator
LRILIIDDSRSITMIVGQMLDSIGIKWDNSIHGKEAIKKLSKDKGFDLIFLDWNMPEMNGIEFLEYNFKNKMVNIPIVMMTTENNPHKIKEATDLGAIGYIIKPFTMDILKDELLKRGLL